MNPVADLLASVAAHALDRRDSPNAQGAAWVFHRGALGDSVLLWPLLRALGAVFPAVHLVADRSKASLAARHTAVAGLDAESPRFNALWRLATPPIIDSLAALVLAFVPPGSTWACNARAAFPAARILALDARPDARTARAIAGLVPWSVAPPRPRIEGPIVAHLGAGAENKRWPMPHWEALARDLPRPFQPLAGEVERERFTPADHAAFSRLGGEFVDNLERLESLLLGAHAFIGADTGPTHLAAALGVPTLAIFGPTDPDQWSPVGASVRSLVPAPAEHWPTVNAVLDATRSL